MADNSWIHDLILQIANVIVYILLIGSHASTITGLKGTYPLGRETYFTPAPYAFGIWHLINLLLFGAIVYQFFPGGKHVIIWGISWRFPMLVVFNAIYVNIHSRQHYIIAFILALFVSSTITHIYSKIKRQYPSRSLNDDVWVHFPISLYHGWATVLVFLSGFEAFGIDAITREAGLGTLACVFFSLFFLEATSATYTYASPEGDVAASAAIAWALFAISQHQKSSSFVHSSAFGFALLSLNWVIRDLYGHFKSVYGDLVTHGRRSRDEERAPLLSGH